MKHTAYVFDAYGTLFDVHSAVRRHAAALGPEAQVLSDIWRTKQLEYTWVRTLCGAYRDFEEITAHALDFAFARVPSASRSVRAALLDAYLTLDAYPEVSAVLARLRIAGARTAILSNGSPAMLEAAVASAGLAPHLDAVFSVDDIRAYKTVAEAYAMVTTAWGMEPAAISFQSSNRWDIAGATRFGFSTVWINRTDQPDEYGDLPPERVLPSLDDLVDA